MNQYEIISILTYFIFNRKTFVLHIITIIILAFYRQQKRQTLSLQPPWLHDQSAFACTALPCAVSVSCTGGEFCLFVLFLSLAGCSLGVTIDAPHAIIRMKAHEKPGNTPLYYIYDRGQSFAGNFFGMACPREGTAFPIFLPARPSRTHPGHLP